MVNSKKVDRKTSREGDTGVRTGRKCEQGPRRRTASAKAPRWEHAGTLGVVTWATGRKQEKGQRNTRDKLGGKDATEPGSEGEGFGFYSERDEKTPAVLSGKVT